MPDTWKERSWEDLSKLEETDLPRERNTDSSVSTQYEDHIPPDHSWEHEDES